TWNSASSVSTRKTTTKKSKASSVQPRNPAVTACQEREREEGAAMELRTGPGWLGCTKSKRSKNDLTADQRFGDDSPQNMGEAARLSSPDECFGHPIFPRSGQASFTATCQAAKKKRGQHQAPLRQRLKTHFTTSSRLRRSPH